MRCPPCTAHTPSSPQSAADAIALVAPSFSPCPCLPFYPEATCNVCLAAVWQSLSTGNFLNLSDHHFQFHTPLPSPSMRASLACPRPELIFPSDTSQVGPILIFTPHTHVWPVCVCGRVCVCMRRLERTFEMRLKTVNSCKGYILGLRVMNAVSAQSQILESVLFD